MKCKCLIAIALVFVAVSDVCAATKQVIYPAAVTVYQRNQTAAARDAYTYSYRPGSPANFNRLSSVPLDYHGNEYNKRLLNEHFTYDPEEAGLVRRGRGN